jgi:hypothetical protein
MSICLQSTMFDREVHGSVDLTTARTVVLAATMGVES